MPKLSKLTQRSPYFYKLRATLYIVLLIGMSTTASLAHADQFDTQINALKTQNTATQGQISGLENQAASYQDAINQLQLQIGAVQNELVANQAQQVSLTAQITAAQNKVILNKGYLANIIKTMYVNGQLSTIEELATSKSLSDYIDKQEYGTKVQDTIDATIQTIAAEQASLQTQKVQLDQLVASEKQQDSQLASDQGQQSTLLAYDQSQQATYNAQIASNASKIASLRQQQIIYNEEFTIGAFTTNSGDGGYPAVWANAPQDSKIDDWGMYNRECVSYTAFKVHEDYLAGKDSHDMPYWGGEGNAIEWPVDARAAGIPVDTTPTPGSIAILNIGAYGHAMYVEAVKGNEIYVQQYNADYEGHYSEGWRYTTDLVFIHF